MSVYMKKKVLDILLIVLLFIGITGCGKENKNNEEPRDSKMTIIDNENKTIKMSVNELYKISTENEAKFKKYYLGAKVSFDGIVSRIEVKDNSCYSETSFIRWQSGKESITGVSKADNTKCSVITFKGGIDLYIPSSMVEDIADINSGDKYHIESNLIYFWAQSLDIYGVSDSGAIDFYNTKIERT